MTVDVVIVTWNSGERVLGCLRCLAGEATAHRTIVVDNASEDATVGQVKQHFPEVEVLMREENDGFGAAVNAGVRLGGGEAVVLVNDDVEIEPGCLAALIEPLARDPHCAMVAGLTTIPATELVDGFGIELDATLAAYNRGRREPVTQARFGRLAVPSGGLAAYRRTAFERAGGFEQRLFAYGEDVDLGLRLLLDGWTAAGCADARGVHLGGASVGVDSPRQRWLAGFARGFLLRRYGVLRTRHLPRTLLFEAMVVGWGLIAHRTLVPLRSRLAGWRAGAGQRLAIPAGVVDRTIVPREAMRRLRHAR